VDEYHRIGGGGLENLRPTPQEVSIDPPGISLVKADSPEQAAQMFRAAFPKAKRLLAKAKLVGSTSAEKIRAAGFDVVADPSRRLPTHQRLIHPQGAAGFTDESLRLLAEAFTTWSEPE
jgi:hypothetical protein